MKHLFLSMAMMLIFASCTEDADQDPTSEPQMIDVTFDVNAFNVSDEPIDRPTRAASPAGSVLDRIEYALKSTTSAYVVKGVQANEPGEPAFGKITVRLPEGSYNLFMWATGKKNTGGKAEFNIFDADPFNAYNEIEGFDKDVFCLSLNEQTIDGSTPSIKCELQRATAKITVQIQDKKPADVDRVDVAFYYQRYFKPFVSGGSQKELTGAIKTLKTKSDGSFEDLECFMFPDKTSKVIFYLYDAENHIIGKAEVKTPTFTNRNTIVRGNLFDLISGKDFDVTVNEIWGEDNIIDMNK